MRHPVTQVDERRSATEQCVETQYFASLRFAFLQGIGFMCRSLGVNNGKI